MIPARDPETLQSLGHYLLLFPNPASARVYQNHLRHLHALSGTHTPTSIESPMAPAPGMVVDGEDVYTLLKDYALYPSSQKISLTMLSQPYGSTIQRTLDHHGYPELVLPNNRSGRSVLCWVNGSSPTTHVLKTFLVKDGQQRGLQWGNLSNSEWITSLKSVTAQTEEVEDVERLPDTEFGPKKRMMRWIISFENDSEAWRFVRSWHRQPFPLEYDGRLHDESSPLVHAEFLW